MFSHSTHLREWYPTSYFGSILETQPLTSGNPTASCLTHSTIQNNAYMRVCMSVLSSQHGRGKRFHGSLLPDSKHNTCQRTPFFYQKSRMSSISVIQLTVTQVDISMDFAYNLIKSLGEYSTFVAIHIISMMAHFVSYQKISNASHYSSILL